MSDYNMEVVPGCRAPVLSAALLAHIHELNRDYVDLLIAERSLPPPGIPADTLPAKVLDALTQLDRPARTALANCSYALYSLGFDDQRFWMAVLADAQPAGATAEESIEARYGALSSAPLQAAFCEVSLFAAWRAAHSHRLAARFLFGMPEAVAEAIIRTPLWQIRRIAIDYPGLATPRWPNNPAFWPDLVRFAATSDAVRIETVRLLGSQLIAAEFDDSAPRAGRQRSRMQLRKRRV